tara:strand:+ start:38139 stop:38552 length:414 start_codon:yes stop_codon:yes gene_type:complete
MFTNKTYYLASLILFSVAIFGAILNSVLNFDLISLRFIALGYPPYLIYILGVAQSLGLVLIIFKQGKFLIEWAYAGFFMNLMFSIIAHLLSKEGNGATAVLCMILLIVNYVFYKKIKYDTRLSKAAKKEYTRLQKVV